MREGLKMKEEGREERTLGTSTTRHPEIQFDFQFLTNTCHHIGAEHITPETAAQVGARHLVAHADLGASVGFVTDIVGGNCRMGEKRRE